MYVCMYVVDRLWAVGDHSSDEMKTGISRWSNWIVSLQGVLLFPKFPQVVQKH